MSDETLEHVGELTIIWDHEKAELRTRLAQLERDMASITRHLWGGHAVEDRSRLDILEAAVRFWSDESMQNHLSLIADLTKRVQSLENHLINLRGANVQISRN